MDHHSTAYSPLYNDDPLTYCLGNDLSQKFNHGGNSYLYGQNSRPCQIYLAQRCARNWDAVCDWACDARSNQEKRVAVGTLAQDWPVQGLTAGDLLLRNTCLEKYRVTMDGCEVKREPFDPLVARSPMLIHFQGRYCRPTYGLKYPIEWSDDDVVLQKLLDRPYVAPDVLRDLYASYLRSGACFSSETRLQRFFQLH